MKHDGSVLIATGYWIGCVRVIFGLSESSLASLLPNVNEVLKHLIYVKWYTAFTEDPDLDTLLFKISPMKDRDGERVCSIIPLANIQRSVQLLPKFGAVMPQGWTSGTMLDLASVFFVNSFTDLHLYCIMC